MVEKDEGQEDVKGLQKVTAIRIISSPKHSIGKGFYLPDVARSLDDTT